jgi:nucleoside-triphosphatase THEP1
LVFLVSGAVGAGKTTAAADCCAALAARGAPVLAFLSVALDRGEGGRALGYDLAAFATAADGNFSELARYALARRERRDVPFAFSSTAFSGALGLLAGSAPHSQVVAVDEIGALELERGGGWAALLDKPPAVPVLVLTVRDSAADALAARLDAAFDDRNAGRPGAPVPSSIQRFRVGPKDCGADGLGPELAEAILRALPDLVDRAPPLG